MSEDKFVHRCAYLKCGYTAYTRPDFKKHMEYMKDNPMHTGLKVIRCNHLKCKNKIFLTKHDYIKHQQEAHKALQDRLAEYQPVPA